MRAMTKMIAVMMISMSVAFGGAEDHGVLFYKELVRTSVNGKVQLSSMHKIRSYVGRIRELLKGEDPMDGLEDVMESMVRLDKRVRDGDMYYIPVSWVEEEIEALRR